MRRNRGAVLFVLSSAVLSAAALNAASTIATFVPLPPCRIADTRVAGGPIAGSTNRIFKVVGVATDFTTQGGSAIGCGVPGFTGSVAQVQAIALNVAAANHAGAGFLTAFAGDTSRPLASTLNFTAGTTIANGVIVPVRQAAPEGNDLKVFVNVTSDVFMDVTGYFTDITLVDGSGSGIDADTLDGADAGAFVSAAGDTMTGALTLPPGAATAPSLNFSLATNTGLFSSANTVGVATNGNSRLLIDGSGLTLTSGSQILLDAGIAANPALAFAGDVNTGLLSPGANANVLTVVTGGIERLAIDSGGLTLSTAGSQKIAVSSDQLLTVSTNGTAMKFVTDEDGDESQTGLEIFAWYANGTAAGDRFMTLMADGSLNVKGTVTANAGFDLAELFWREGPLAQGELVRIVPGSPHAVARSQGEGDPLAIGVVSTNPGMVLGGAAFTVEGLRSGWGEPIARRFAAEQEALRATPKCRTAAAADREACALHGFLAEHFVPVALAGRVPVAADASFGPIVPGDALAPSALPGVARKATQGDPIIGIALDELARGRGQVFAFVHHQPAGAAVRELAAALRAKERETEGLRAELAELRGRVKALESLEARLATLAARMAHAADEGPAAEALR